MESQQVASDEQGSGAPGSGGDVPSQQKGRADGRPHGPKSVTPVGLSHETFPRTVTKWLPPSV